METTDIQTMCKLYKSGLTLREIGQKTGYHHKTVSKYLKKSGIKIVRKPLKTKLNPKVKHYQNKQMRDEEIIKQYLEGIGSPTIAKSLRIDKRTVLKVLKDNNIKRNNKYVKPRPQKHIVKKLYKDGKTIEQLATEFNVPTYAISKQLDKIKRSPGETMSSLRGLEDKIKSLYSEGLSTYDIADALGFSHAESIRRFIKSENLTRSKEEIRRLTALKLSNTSYQSRPEKQMAVILDKLGIQYSSQHPLEGWNFDFKIDNILIEIQSYWHLLPKRIQRDKKKAQIAKKHNFKLVYLWEHQFKNEDFIKELLYYKLNLKPPLNFDFNQLEIKKNRHDAIQLMKWHYHQKIGRYGHEYVAYLENTPIAACTFASILRQQTAKKQMVTSKEILELVRFVIHPNYHKKNFGSWFSSRCIKLLKIEQPQLKKIIAFSDTTYNHNGNIYRASNWIYDGKIPSDYWYVTPTRTVKHKKTIWNAAKKENLTESEYSKKYKMQKVYGLPKHRFIKSI